jgi:hypothetical protein
MPVRGTTAWQHAIIQKKIINNDRGGTYVMCAWLDCENDACSVFQVRERTHANAYESTDARYVIYAFCSEKCKQYWLEATFNPGSHQNLPKGFKGSIL